MIRQTDTRTSHSPTIGHDLEALILVVGILGVITILCLLAAVWPEGI